MIMMTINHNDNYLYLDWVKSQDLSERVIQIVGPSDLSRLRFLTVVCKCY